MSDIPQARRLIEQALKLLTREKYVRRAKNRAVRITPKLAKEVRSFERRNPELTEAEIASHFKINGGRVSEILNGKRWG